MTALKHLAILLALLAGGFSLAMIADFVSDHDAQLIKARQAWAPESASAAQHSTPADQPVSEIGRTGASGAVAPPVATVASPVAAVQEAQPTSAPAMDPAQKRSRTPHKHPQKYISSADCSDQCHSWRHYSLKTKRRGSRLTWRSNPSALAKCCYNQMLLQIVVDPTYNLYADHPAETSKWSV
ncbi:MAG: hypothetical protein WAK55_03715 [Xanthobacteraceae bacterium]